MTPEKTVLCVIFVSWNSKRWLRTLLPQLFKTIPVHTHIICVDNASSDDTVAYLAHYPAIDVVKLSQNTGFAAGCNCGIAHARQYNPEYICLLNTDVTLPQNWIAKLLAFIELHPRASVVGPLVMNYDRSGLSMGTQHTHPTIARDYVSKKLKKNYEVEAIEGCCMLIRTSVFDRIGMFDETYGKAYFEEMDLERRIRASGGYVYLVSSSRIGHFEKGSALESSALKQQYKQNEIYFHLTDPQHSFLQNIINTLKLFREHTAQSYAKSGRIDLRANFYAIVWNFLRLPKTWRTWQNHYLIKTTRKL